MITFKEVDKSYLSQYDAIPMLVYASSYYRIEKQNRGLGGFTLVETPVDPYVKDLGMYGLASEYEKQFDVSNWAFFMAFDGAKAIGGTTIVSRTKAINMLSGRDDLAVLWDIRVDDAYKGQGIGQRLFDMSVAWSKSRGLAQLKIECQNNNIPACRFYHKQGAILSAIDEYAYYSQPELRHEAQLIWYLDL